MTDGTAADAALERADAKELHTLFQRAEQRYAQMEDALTKVMMHYVGEKDVPRYVPNESAIAAMERVAMEALTLARFVVEQVKKETE